MVVDCPDLRNEPFKVACAGLTEAETAADIGGQLNLFPQPRPDRKYSLIECARIMGLPEDGGAILGAGAGPAHVHGTPSELAPHLSWQGGFDKVHNPNTLYRDVSWAKEEARMGRLVDHPTLLRMPQKHGRSPIQVALAWRILSGKSVFPKSTIEGQILEKIDAGRIVLDEEDLSAILTMDQKARCSDPSADFGYDLYVDLEGKSKS